MQLFKSMNWRIAKMSGNKHLGGRPSKLDMSTKKAIIMDFFVKESECQIEVMQKRDIFARIAKFASNNGYDVKAYDFSRNDEVKIYIEDLILQNKQSPERSNNWAYNSINTEYFCRPDISLEARRTLLVEQDDYYRKIYLQATAAINMNETLQKTNSVLLKENTQLKARNSEITAAFEEIKINNGKLTSEARYLKSYIKKYMTPEIADKIISGKDLTNLSSNVSSLIVEGDPKDICCSAHTKQIEPDRIAQKDTHNFDTTLSAALNLLK